MKSSTDEFIEKAKKIHFDKYDYSLVDYKKSKLNVKIICPTHGVFEQTPSNHLLGSGCLKCSVEKQTKGQDKFISEAKKIHFDKYDYSLVSYTNNHSKVKIICPIHGVFEQIALNHLAGHGCAKCSDFSVKKKQTKGQDKFISEANQIHNNKYDYSFSEYKNARTKVKIICPIHGAFLQTPDNHLRGNGCPKCKHSGGEDYIETFLLENNIDFVHQKKFDDLKDRKKLSYDFYLTEKNILIEYNGRQHYQPVKYYGGRKKFLLQKHHDWLKREYAKKNGYNLLVIRFDEDIDKKLKEVI